MNDGVLAVAKNEFFDGHQAAALIRLAEKGLGQRDFRRWSPVTLLSAIWG